MARSLSRLDGTRLDGTRHDGTTENPSEPSLNGEKRWHDLL